MGTFLPVCAAFLLIVCSSVSKTETVNGEWSPWAVGSSCNVTCGAGYMVMFRSCTNPSPQEGGIQCLNEDNVTRGDLEQKISPCNEQKCTATNWTEWYNCSVNCGMGMQYKYAIECSYSGCAINWNDKQERACNTWNKTVCPSPCQPGVCPQYANCVDNSTATKPSKYCTCTMGYMINDDGTACVRPPPTTPEPRPIPTLPPEQKVAATALSKGASTVLIVFVSLTLALFLLLRIFTPDRVIQMNMEIALLIAHLFLLFPSNTAEIPVLCKAVSIAIHYFFTACYFFMFLESLHMFSLIAYVVKKDGIFSRTQNILIGWGGSAIVVMTCVCLSFTDYGGEYHCWLQMDKTLLYGQFIPVVALCIITLTLTEAAGADEYAVLTDVDKKQRQSAKFSRRTNVLLLPLVFVHWYLGMLSEYEQNIYLYGIFSIMNAVLGVCVFFFHCSNNTEVRKKLRNIYAKMCKSTE